VYHHVWEGAAAIAALSLVLVAVTAWQLDHFATVAPALVSAILLTVLTPTVLFARRRYRHVLAGALTLAVLFVCSRRSCSDTVPRPSSSSSVPRRPRSPMP
jgi:hypothetical protein